MTDIELKKIDYTNNYENDDKWPTMHIIGRTADSQRVHITNDKIRPYFYIPADEFNSDIENHEAVTGKEVGYESIYGDDLIRIYTRIPGDVPKIRDDFEHYEADILFPNRFLIDTDIWSGMSIPEEHATNEPTEVTLDEIEDTEIHTDTHICYCDIEVDDEHGFPDEEEGNEEIVSVSLYDSFTEEYHAWLYHPANPTITHDDANIYVFRNEVEMLTSFCEYVTTHTPDILTGWNFKDFDAKYIVNRLSTLDNISQNDISPLGSAYDDGFWGGKIKGIAVFDMLRAYKNLQFTDLDSYRLENVSQAVLGEGKIQDPRSVHEQWEDDPQQLIDYNIRDVELTVLLEEHEAIIGFFEEVQNFVGGRLTEVIDYSNAVDIYILRKVSGEYVLPSQKTIEAEETFEGAWVKEAASGVMENVIVEDLKSLYPMSMKTLNAGPTTLDPDGDITAPNGVSFTSDKDAIITEIIDELLEERELKKDQRDEYDTSDNLYKVYDRQQTAVKIIMNTLYGVAGWEKFRLYEKDTAAAVTATGREVITYTEEVVTEMGYEVTYGDTDSVMLKLDEEFNMRECIEVGFKIEDEINATYDEFAQHELGVDEHWFEIEFEKLYKRYFQASKKKRYAGHIIWKEGKVTDDIDITGFEFKRSDYGKVPRELQQEVLDILVKGGGLTDIGPLIRERLTQIRNMEYSLEELGIPGSITKQFHVYDSKTLHVNGSEYANKHLDAQIRPGDKPKGMYVKRIKPSKNGDSNYPMPDMNTPFICWLNAERIPDEIIFNMEKYIEVQIKNPLSRILNATDWSWGEVITGERQSSLSRHDGSSEQSEESMFSEAGNALSVTQTQSPNNGSQQQKQQNVSQQTPSYWQSENGSTDEDMVSISVDIPTDTVVEEPQTRNDKKETGSPSLTEY